MIIRAVTGLRVAAAWHRLLLRNSPNYRQACRLLASFIANGYWDIDEVSREDLEPY